LKKAQGNTNIILDNITDKLDAHDNRIRKIETYDVDARLNDF